jgi:2-polyprenyl-3-methyl-5-hydroxy-6-metoxy-1,4-benzoquinol methylase
MPKIKDIALDDTPEEYDKYFEQLGIWGCKRSIDRAKRAIGLIDKRQGKILSIGVGDFGEASELRKAGFDVTICDISPLAVETAKQQGYKAFEFDITKNVPNEKYDIVFALEILEHVINPLAAVKNLKGFLNDNGRMVISLPNEFNLRARLQVLFGFPPFGGHDCHHLRFFNSKFGRHLFTESNLEVMKETYCPVIPLWNRLSVFLGELLQGLSPNLFSLSFIWLLQPKRVEKSRMEL